MKPVALSLVFISFFLFFPFFRIAQGATYTAISCSRVDVQSAIDTSMNGDIISIPAGTCSWSDPVSIVGKTITLQGAGSTPAGTVINYSGTNHSLIAIDPGTQRGSLTISGFRFVGGDPNYWGGMHIQFSGPDEWRGLRIHHNVFIGSQNNVIRGSTETEGLIDNNIFEGSSHSIQLDGRGSDDWNRPIAYGSAGFFFVENNTFNNDDTYGNTGWFAVDVTNGGRNVFRYNTLRNSFWENHDRCRSGLPSSRAFEIYNNNFTKDSVGHKAIDLSSGDGVIFQNNFSLSWNVPIGAYKGGDESCLLPPNEIPGALAPIYTWENTLNTGGSANTVFCTSSIELCSQMNFQEGEPMPSYSPYIYPHPLASSTPTFSPCSTLTPSSSLPGGYGSPFDLFLSNTPLVAAECTSSDIHTLKATIGIPGNQTRVSYTKGYWYNPGTSSWVEYTGACSGTQNGNWCQGPVTATVTHANIDTTSAQTPVTFVGMTCSVQNGAWKCGCRDTSCSSFLWQVQGAGR
ncbi:MAG: hypothetical protein IPL87_03820 [Candidatus Moraniibacteriota bacterium]|nr:MAG: hypothetical protein IPL87_03820 [Candidatus Moranbacteria bacterium]